MDAATIFPETHTSLYFVQVLLRVLGRALVMWDTVEPSQAWLDAQLPHLLRVSSTNMSQSVLSSLAPDSREWRHFCHAATCPTVAV